MSDASIEHVRAKLAAAARVLRDGLGFICRVIANLIAWPLQAMAIGLGRAYLHWMIRSAEADLRWMQHQIDHAATLPKQIAVTRAYISALRVKGMT